MHPSSSNQRHSEATTKGHAQRARGAMYAPVDPFKPSVALGVKKILGKAKDRTIDDIPVDRAGGGGGRERKENELATRPSNEHPYSLNNVHYRPAVPPPPPLQNWYPNVPGSVQAPYGYGGYLAPNPTWTSPYGQYAPDNTWAPQGSTGGLGQGANNNANSTWASPYGQPTPHNTWAVPQGSTGGWGQGNDTNNAWNTEHGLDWAAGAGWGQGGGPAWSGWSADKNGDLGLYGGGGEWGLSEGGITGAWPTFGSGDTRDGEGHAGEAWGSGNIEGLDELWGGEATAGGGGGLYAPPNEAAGEIGGLGTVAEDPRRHDVVYEEDDDDERGIANGSFFQQNNTVERAPESPQTVPPDSDDAAPLDSLLEKLRSGDATEQRRRRRYSSHSYAPSSPAPSQLTRIPPPNNALPVEASPFGLFGELSPSQPRSQDKPRDANAPLAEDDDNLGHAERTSGTGATAKSCSRCHTTSTPLRRVDRTTDEPLCEACYMTPDNEVKQPVSQHQLTSTSDHETLFQMQHNNHGHLAPRPDDAGASV